MFEDHDEDGTVYVTTFSPVFVCLFVCLFVPSRIALKYERTTTRVVPATHIHSLALFTRSAHTPIPPSFSYTVKIYHLDGNLFFGSLRTLQRLMTPDADPDIVVLLRKGWATSLNGALKWGRGAGLG